MNYVANIYRKMNGRYKLLKTEKFKPDTKALSYKGKNKGFIIDMGAISHEDEKNAYLCFDFDTGDSLSFNEVKRLLAPEDVDGMVLQSTVATLFARVFRGLQESDKGKLLTYIAIFVVGLLLGYFANGYMGSSTPATGGGGTVAETVATEILRNVSACLCGLF